MGGCDWVGSPGGGRYRAAYAANNIVRPISLEFASSGTVPSTAVHWPSMDFGCGLKSGPCFRIDNEGF